MHACLPGRFLRARVAMGGVLLLAVTGAQAGQDSRPDLLDFLRVASGDDQEMAEDAVDRISTNWRDGYAGMVWDMLRLQQPPRPHPLPPPSVGGAMTAKGAFAGRRLCEFSFNVTRGNCSDAIRRDRTAGAAS